MTRDKHLVIADLKELLAMSKSRKYGYVMDIQDEQIIGEALELLQPEAAEMAETLKRLRSQIPGCDCDNPAQCWESCGTLGHSEEHMKVIKDSNKP